MEEKIEQMIVSLKDLIDFVPYKIKEDINISISLLDKFLESKDFSNFEILIKVQEQLEMIASFPNLDSYSSSEIYTLITDLEDLM